MGGGVKVHRGEKVDQGQADLQEGSKSSRGFDSIEDKAKVRGTQQ